MKLPLRIISLCLPLLATSAVITGEALGTLGESADSIPKDRKVLGTAKRAITRFPKYSIEESASNATTVRQYVSLSGVVFAVGWNGLVPPDLTQLLGSYACEYEAAKEQLPRTYGRKRAQVTAEHVVVETWGHMKDLRGRAYLPTMVPAGVDINEIH